MKRVEFKVSMVLPDGATVADARAYVLDAVSSMKGCLQPPGYGPGGYDPNEPGDPMSMLEADRVRVTTIRKEKAK